MVAVNEAYKVLSDPVRRKQYDAQLMLEGLTANRARSAPQVANQPFTRLGLQFGRQYGPWQAFLGGVIGAVVDAAIDAKRTPA